MNTIKKIMYLVIVIFTFSSCQKCVECTREDMDGNNYQYEIYDDNGNLAEWPEWGSGNSQGENPPRTSVIYHKVKFYNDDLFLQVGKDTLETNQSNLGLVYKRIK